MLSQEKTTLTDPVLVNKIRKELTYVDQDEEDLWD